MIDINNQFFEKVSIFKLYYIYFIIIYKFLLEAKKTRQQQQKAQQRALSQNHTQPTTGSIQLNDSRSTSESLDLSSDISSSGTRVKRRRV